MGNIRIDTDKLTELWKEGMTAAKISELTGWRKDSIYKAIVRIGLPRHRNGKVSLLEDPEKRKFLIKNYSEISNNTISVFLGVSQRYVVALARSLGLKKSNAFFDSIKEYKAKRLKEYYEAKKARGEKITRTQPRINGRFAKKTTQ